MKLTITLLGALAAITLQAAAQNKTNRIPLTADPNKRPNIILIMADDLDYGSLGCYGSTEIRTPNIDRLAASGMRFTDFHSNSSVCSPTRAALLTGRYQQRCAWVSDEELSLVFRDQRKENLPQRWAWGIATNELTIAELLRQAGYRTGIIGKWHLGYDFKFHPMNYGFDEFRGYVGGNVDYHTHVAGYGLKQLDWWNGKKIENDDGYTTDLLTKYATDFIARHKNQPFFLYLAHAAPHDPWQGRDSSKKKSPQETYKEMIEILDESVGTVNRNQEQVPMNSKHHKRLIFAALIAITFPAAAQTKTNSTNYDCLDTIRYLLANRSKENGYLGIALELNAWIEKIFLDKIEGFEPAEGIREQLACNVVMGIHSLNWASMLIELSKATGDNPLLKHSFLRVAGDKRHFEHADGTPFLWLADTWWKNLCQRMTWEKFQELTADRKAKGFNAVQIVCGPYPDENMMETRWENEGGKPYEKIDFSVVNPKYFDFADRRIKHLVDGGIMPVIVGEWGRPQGGGKSTLAQVGLDGFKRHWRNLIARYGAYPTVWIVGGEAKDAYGPWSELAKYLKKMDPYHHPVAYHAPGNPRKALKDNSMFDFDMVAIGHDGMKTVTNTAGLIKSCLEATPKRPVLCGEACYEGHMQTNWQDLQRQMFWRFMLCGAAGHTYGAAGVWQASVEGDPGIDPVYDWTPWKEGMSYSGSTQLGLGKILLEQYPWSRFEPHPEWAEADGFAAGIPGKVRFIYQPKRNIYNWKGTVIKGLEPGVRYTAFYFDPASGRRFD